jgi:hypothetical protein
MGPSKPPGSKSVNGNVPSISHTVMEFTIILFPTSNSSSSAEKRNYLAAICKPQSDVAVC